KPARFRCIRTIPVPQMNIAAHGSTLKASDETVKVRRDFEIHTHPQQYREFASRLSAIKLHTVQRFCGPCTGVRRWRKRPESTISTLPGGIRKLTDSSSFRSNFALW